MATKATKLEVETTMKKWLESYRPLRRTQRNNKRQSRTPVPMEQHASLDFEDDATPDVPDFSRNEEPANQSPVQSAVAVHSILEIKFVDEADVGHVGDVEDGQVDEYETNSGDDEYMDH